MLGNVHLTQSLKPSCCEPARARPSLSWLSARIMRAICSALIDAVSAQRRYEEMRRLGIPHQTALSRALEP
jgi:hypothetical protein